MTRNAAVLIQFNIHPPHIHPSILPSNPHLALVGAVQPGSKGPQGEGGGACEEGQRGGRLGGWVWHPGEAKGRWVGARRGASWRQREKTPAKVPKEPKENR